MLPQSMGRKKWTKTARNSHNKIHKNEMAKRMREISKIPALFTFFYSYHFPQSNIKSSSVDISKIMDRFHMRSRHLYWCSKTMKRRPCCCSKRFFVGVELFSHVNVFFCNPINFAKMLST